MFSVQYFPQSIVIFLIWLQFKLRILLYIHEERHNKNSCPLKWLGGFVRRKGKGAICFYSGSWSTCIAVIKIIELEIVLGIVTGLKSNVFMLWLCRRDGFTSAPRCILNKKGRGQQMDKISN